MNILISDDNQPFTEGLKRLLSRFYPKVETTETTNGTDALALITEGNSYDLALIDLMLPGMNGFSLLEHLTQAPYFVPVLIISSSEDPENIKQALQLGASGFISKSFTPSELNTAIDTILSGGIYQP